MKVKLFSKSIFRKKQQPPSVPAPAVLSDDDDRKKALLTLFSNIHSLEHAIFLCEMRDILIESKNDYPALQDKIASLFDRYIINPQDNTYSHAGTEYRAIASDLNISGDMIEKVKAFDVKNAKEEDLLKLISNVFNAVNNEVVSPALRDNRKTNVLLMFKDMQSMINSFQPQQQPGVVKKAGKRERLETFTSESRRGNSPKR